MTARAVRGDTISPSPVQVTSLALSGSYVVEAASL